MVINKLTAINNVQFSSTIIIALLCISTAFAQNSSEYLSLIREGWKLCLEKNCISSAEFYEKAFEIGKDIPLSDRYNASYIYTLADNVDMAFHHLFIVGNKMKWADHDRLINDTDLKSLHDDTRWKELSDLILLNKKEEEAHFIMDLVAALDHIYFDGQSTRNQIRSTEEEFGRESEEMDALWQEILKRDSINLIKVSKILDEEGWPAKSLIGERGTSTLFLVIQHADQKAQEKYLPLIVKAMVDNNLPKRQYAMFYDRLLLRQEKRQLYGTQLALSKESKVPYVLPLEDLENVDQRRSQMGLNTMQNNLNRWKITWDTEEYLKSLTAIEAKEKELDNKNN